MKGFTESLLINLLLAAIVAAIVNRIYKVKIKGIEKDHDKALMAAKIEVQEEVSRNVAAELHDNIGAYLTLTRMSLKRFLEEKKIQAGDETDFKKIISVVEQATDELRGISRSLGAFYVEDFNFFDCLEMDLDRVINNRTCKINYAFEGSNERLPPVTALMMFRMYQEVMSNIYKHAKATKVDIKIKRTEEFIIMDFQDNGIGFNYDEQGKKPDKFAGIGLLNISKRAEYLDGKTWIKTSPGNGTKFVIKVKLNDK